MVNRQSVKGRAPLHRQIGFKKFDCYRQQNDTENFSEYICASLAQLFFDPIR
jgi:hypothetical protein